MNERRGAVAIITGCSSGIGRATAIHLAARGWRVFATARRLESVNDLASDQITALRLDVTDEATMTATIDQVLALTGRIDALVNNAGYAEGGPLERASAEEVRGQFETNTFGPLRLAQLVLPAMRSQGSGRIVNVSSIAGRVAMPFIGLYSASKFALEALSDALRLETRLFGVDVIIVEPGGVRTDFSAVAHRRSSRFATEQDSPYSRYFTGFDHSIAGMARWSASPEDVARVVHQALTAGRPKARYAATPMARLMLAAVPRLPDRLRDAALSRSLGLEARGGSQ